MRLRDSRTIEEQIWSGVRIAGYVWLTIVVAAALLSSAASVTGEPNRFLSDPRMNRIVGACGLILLSLLMFLMARRWVRLLIGSAAQAVLYGVIALLLYPQSALKTSHMIFGEQVALAAVILVLSFKYFYRAPRRIEAIGLTGSVISLSFGIVQKSFVPPLVGIGWLGLAQIVDWILGEARHDHSMPRPLEERTK